jgi:hypothetical protein
MHERIRRLRDAFLPVPRPIDDPITSNVHWIRWSWRRHFFPFVPPLRYKGRSGVRVSLVVLASQLGLDTHSIEGFLREHDQRFSRRWRTMLIMYFVFSALILALLIVALAYFGVVERRHFFSMKIGDGLPLSTFPAFPIFTIFICALSMKLAGLLTDRYFAETLAAVCILHILIELEHPSALRRLDRKRALLSRFRYLARSVILTSLRYSPQSDITRLWVREHFSHILAFVRERERWVIVPTSTTKVKLQQDLTSVVHMFVTGTYGDFAWESQSRADSPQRIPTWRRAIAGLGRTSGFVIPLLLMGYFISHPEQLTRVGIQPNTLALISLAWLLLSVDVLFRLGLVSSVIELAKGIRALR